MGLDISGYTGLEYREPYQPEATYTYDYTILLPTLEGEVDRSDGLRPGVYEYRDRYGFRAGSYLEYNWWRKELCKLFHNCIPEALWEESPERKGPFVELICFSDCEGVIGPVTSVKLLKDFEENKERAEGYAGTFKDGEIWLVKYRHWAEAFRFATKEGAVKFH